MMFLGLLRIIYSNTEKFVSGRHNSYRDMLVSAEGDLVCFMTYLSQQRWGVRFEITAAATRILASERFVSRRKKTEKTERKKEKLSLQINL